MFHPLDAVQF